MNQRPSGPQPDALPDCATPRDRARCYGANRLRATLCPPVRQAANHHEHYRKSRLLGEARSASSIRRRHVLERATEPAT